MASQLAWLVLGAVVGAIATWALSYFWPGVYRHVTKRPALHVHVETDGSIIWSGAPPWLSAGFMMPSTDNLGPPPSEFCPDWWGWAHSVGAIDASQTEVRLTFTAAQDTTIVLNDLRPKIIKQTEIPEWSYVQCMASGGADITPRQVSIDLDSMGSPLTRFIDDRQDDRDIHKKPVLSVTKGEAELFHMVARAGHSYVEWTAEALLVVDGKRQVLPIDDRGKPFRTCGTGRRPMLTWTDGKWQEFPTRTSN